MTFFSVYVIGLAVILGLMTLLWLVSLWLKNSSIVDIFWGTGFVIANWIYYALTPEGYMVRKLLIGILVTLWGLRLSIYILYRNWGKQEDFRYQKWRGEAGSKWWWQSFFRVFLLQGILIVGDLSPAACCAAWTPAIQPDILRLSRNWRLVDRFLF